MILSELVGRILRKVAEVRLGMFRFLPLLRQETDHFILLLQEEPFRGILRYLRGDRAILQQTFVDLKPT